MFFTQFNKPSVKTMYLNKIQVDVQITKMDANVLNILKKCNILFITKCEKNLAQKYNYTCQQEIIYWSMAINILRNRLI